MSESIILFRGTPGQFADIVKYLEGQLCENISDPLLRVGSQPAEPAQRRSATVVTIAFQTSVNTGIDSRDIGGAGWVNYAAQQLGKPALIYEYGRLTAVAAPGGDSHLELLGKHSKEFPNLLRDLLADLTARGYVRDVVLVAYVLPKNECCNDDFAFQFKFEVINAAPNVPPHQTRTVCNVRVEMDGRLAYNWKLADIDFELTPEVLDVARQAAIASLRQAIITDTMLPLDLPTIKFSLDSSPHNCPFRPNRMTQYRGGELILMLERGSATEPSTGAGQTTSGGVTINAEIALVNGDVTGRDKIVAESQADADKAAA